MKQLILIFLLFMAGCLSISQDTSSSTEPRDILIIYTGNLMAELKPCGCDKEEDQGGIERRMQYLTDTRKAHAHTLLVDTGDHFKDPTRQGKLKAETLLTATEKMAYDAVALGDRDLVYGSQFLQDRNHIPWIAGNLKVDKFEPAPSRVKTFANGLKVGILAVADPHLFYDHVGLRIEDPKQTVRKLTTRMRKKEKPDLIVLLTHAKRETALAYLDLDGIDIVINGHIVTESDVIDMTPVWKKGKVFVQSSPRGQKMGELKVQVDSKGNKSIKQSMVKLDSSVKFDPEMVKLYKKYNEQVEAMFFEALADKRSKNKQSVYAGETVCKNCHPAEHQVWSKSRHGRAYNTLRKINKAFDPECLVCHVVGFNLPGGFISELDSPGLKNVQCEVCHGSGREHASAPKPGFGSQAKKACKQCHVKNHSPRFNYAKYWPKIKH
jgi:2',3'-cyclic-nucleotide 2'-phosphodiesterase (5'-nucleotidase family)